MKDYNEMRVNSSSLTPMIDNSETQIILQRHCNYDRTSGFLVQDSINEQKRIVDNFVLNLKEKYGYDNVFFLFSASNTIGAGDLRRCIDSTNIIMDYIVNTLGEGHVLNFRSGSNYKNKIHDENAVIEPKMYIDGTGYYEFLLNKYGDENIDFWTAFEEDTYKEEREKLNAEGPDEIVNRGIKYICALQKYATWFHNEYPNCKLIIWTGTHYDLISPLVKKIRGWDKTDVVWVDYSGGISINIDKENNIVANVNGINYPFDLQYKKQLHRHF